MVPVKSFAIFECKAYCIETCRVNWRINESATTYQFQKHRFIERGFNFSHSPDSENDIYASTLSVNASALVNNTHLYCTAIIYGVSRSFTNRSSNATLLVASGKLQATVEPLIMATSDEWLPSLYWSRLHHYSE